MNDDDRYEKWIEQRRAVGPGPEFTDAVMTRVRRATARAGRSNRWAAAAVWGLAAIAGLWRAAQVLGPFITG